MKKIFVLHESDNIMSWPVSYHNTLKGSYKELRRCCELKYKEWEDDRRKFGYVQEMNCFGPRENYKIRMDKPHEYHFRITREVLKN